MKIELKKCSICFRTAHQSQQVERSKQPAPNRNNAVEYSKSAQRVSGLIDFLHQFEFVLEFIVANPSLYDRKNEHYRDEHIKLMIWNEMCTAFYEKRK